MSKSNERLSYYEYPVRQTGRLGAEIKPNDHIVAGPDYDKKTGKLMKDENGKPITVKYNADSIFDTYNDKLNNADNIKKLYIKNFDMNNNLLVIDFKNNDERYAMNMLINKDYCNNPSLASLQELLETVQTKAKIVKQRKVNYKKMLAIVATSAGLALTGMGLDRALEKQAATEYQNYIDSVKEVNEAEGYNKIDIPGTTEEEVNTPTYSEEEKQALREDGTTPTQEEIDMETAKQKYLEDLANEQEEEMDFYGFDEPAKSR